MAALPSSSQDWIWSMEFRQVVNSASASTHSRKITHRTVASDRVVDGLDIVEDVSAWFGSGLVVLTTHLFLFQARPEALHRRVVVAISASTH